MKGLIELNSGKSLKNSILVVIIALDNRVWYVLESRFFDSRYYFSFNCFSTFQSCNPFTPCKADELFESVWPFCGVGAERFKKIRGTY